jgi:predicted RNase H-like HicB family nuclease/DNA-binding XRE family transcriptional regulator
MRIAYPFRFTPEAEGGFSVQGMAPLTGVITQGDSLDEARHHAREALTVMLEGLLDDGDPVPPPPASALESAELIEPEPDVVPPLLLRWSREAANLTQGELATRLGMTQQGYAKLERSGANPTIKTLAKVARALGRQLQIAM